MQSERFSLRGAILLGLALLAAAAWLATVLGVGTRIRGEDNSEVAAPRLPTLPDAAADPMAAPSSYSAINERPVFAEDRRPHPFRLGGQQQATPGGALRLTGVLLSGSFGIRRGRYSWRSTCFLFCHSTKNTSHCRYRRLHDSQ